MMMVGPLRSVVDGEPPTRISTRNSSGRGRRFHILASVEEKAASDWLRGAIIVFAILHQPLLM